MTRGIPAGAPWPASHRGPSRLPAAVATLLGLVAVGLVAGCATGRTEMPYTPGRTAGPPLSAAAFDAFPYERVPAPVSNHTEGTADGYIVRRLRFPSVGENGQDSNMVTVRYFERARGGPRPLVVVLPIWGGHTYPSAIVGRDLLDEGGVNVMRVLGADMVIDWDALAQAPAPAAFRVQLRRMVERVRATVIDLRRLLDWVETRPAVDVTRIAMVGFSESTLQVAGIMASDPRLSAAVLVMGGAHPHQIFAMCYGPPAEVREQVLPRFGWTAEQFADEMAPLVQAIDPAHLGSRLHPERVLIFDAEHDDCVPRMARDALWEVSGRPARVSVRATHAGAFLGMTFLGGNHIRHRMMEFFEQAFRVEGDAPPRARRE